MSTGSPPLQRCSYRQAVDSLGILTILADFDPHLAGTPPLGLALPESDIDILCHAPDADAFCAVLIGHYGSCANFSIHQWTGNGRPVVASFEAQGWCFEIFGNATPVREQAGWRHFAVEQRLLDLGGDSFRATIMALRHTGLKTEPAFAAALGLAGDPYQAMLDLHDTADDSLARLLHTAANRGDPAMQPPIIDIVRNDPTAADQNSISDALTVFNAEKRGTSEELPDFAVLIRDPQTGAVTGGLYAIDGYGWAFVKYLVVPKQYRGMGLGTRLLQEVETIARDRGYIGVWLDTFEFQARPFYEKMGYSVFGELEGSDGAIPRYFLKKRF